MPDAPTAAQPAPELHSRRLATDEWEPALDALAAFFREAFPGSIVTAEYGFGCGIHADLTYVTMRIGVGWLDSFFRESIAQRIFVPGESDIFVYAPDRQLSVTFCHEADVHVSAVDQALRQRLFSTAPFDAFEFPNT